MIGRCEGSFDMEVLKVLAFRKEAGFIDSYRMAVAASGALGAIILAGVAGVAFLIVFMAGNDTGGCLTRGGLPTEIANRELGQYLSIFRAAEEVYGVDWTILGALAKLQTDCGAYPRGTVTPDGEVGFIRFLPVAWSGDGAPAARNDPLWRPCPDPPLEPLYSAGNDVAALPYLIKPEEIASFRGAGVDGDLDGIADPYNPHDAVFAAARQLAALLEANDNDYQKALSQFLAGDEDMARRVIGKARLYTVFTLPGAALIWPIAADIEGYDYISSPFGMRVHPVTGVYKLHTGIDIAVGAGTPIMACHSGKVVSSGWRGAYGHCVILESLDGSMQTLYGHMQSHPLVEYGETISIGTVMGYVGSTGNSTGNHLHLEIRLANNGGECIDPLSMLNPRMTMAYVLESPFTRGGDFAALFDVAQPSGLDAAVLEAFILEGSPGNSIFWQYRGQLGAIFLAAEQRYGVNAAFLACLAIHESAWGSSSIARAKNNVFGWQAYNSNPGAARGFADLNEGVMYVAGQLARTYLSPQGEYYNGTSIAGINRYYCVLDSSEPDYGWSRDISALIQNLYGRDLISTHGMANY